MRPDGVVQRPVPSTGANKWEWSHTPPMRRDDRAVSPVMGVLLLVAMAIAMATVVYGFGAGLTLDETAPRAALVAQVGNGIVHVRHRGGDPVPVAGTSLTVQTAEDAVRHALSDLDGTYSQGNPDLWETGEHVCVSCAHRGDDLREVAVIMGGQVAVVWTGAFQVPP